MNNFWSGHPFRTFLALTLEIKIKASMKAEVILTSSMHIAHSWADIQLLAYCSRTYGTQLFYNAFKFVIPLVFARTLGIFIVCSNFLINAVTLGLTIYKSDHQPMSGTFRKSKQGHVP